MPNHITNILTIDGPASRVKEIYAAISPAAPEPLSTPAEPVSKEEIFKPATPDELAIRRKNLREIDFNKIVPTPSHIYQGDLGQEEQERYGRDNWYDWNINNWGTKWNAYDQEMLDDKTISFNTAWSMPQPVIRALSEKFPDVTVKVKWADEDFASNTGELHYRNGREVFVNVPEALSKEAYELAFDILGGEDEYRWDEEEGTYVYIEESLKEAEEIFKPATPEELEKRREGFSEPAPREIIVVYKGDRENPGDYDNFTLNKQYRAWPATAEEIEDPDAWLRVVNDVGEEVLHPYIDFDFIDFAVTEAEEIFKPATPDELEKRREGMFNEYIVIAQEVGLSPERAELFKNYMKTRWPHQTADSYYAEEWAERFKNGREWDLSDLAGQRVLKRLAPGIYESEEIFKPATPDELQKRKLRSLDKRVVAGVDSYWGGGATYVNDPQYGWISVGGAYFDWVRDGRQAGVPMFDKIRWLVTKDEKERLGLHESEEIFKPASPEELEQRKRVEREAAEREHGARLTKMKEIADKAGFTERADIDVTDDVVYTAWKDDLKLSLTCAVRWYPNRLSVYMSRGSSQYRSINLALTLRAETIAKKIVDVLLPQFAGGDTGWQAENVPKARYRKYCGVCSKDIPTGARYLRLGTGQGICKDCVQKAGRLIEGKWVINGRPKRGGQCFRYRRVMSGMR